MKVCMCILGGTPACKKCQNYNEMSGQSFSIDTIESYKKKKREEKINHEYALFFQTLFEDE